MTTPDTAALVAELRASHLPYDNLHDPQTCELCDQGNAAMGPDFFIPSDMPCGGIRAADALEAQAARITELEAAIRAALHRATLRNEPDPELEAVLDPDA